MPSVRRHTGCFASGMPTMQLFHPISFPRLAQLVCAACVASSVMMFAMALHWDLMGWAGYMAGAACVMAGMQHAIQVAGNSAGGTPSDVRPSVIYCGRTMNPQTYAVLSEIARLANVTPQQALEDISSCVLEDAVNCMAYRDEFVQL